MTEESKEVSTSADVARRMATPVSAGARVRAIVPTNLAELAKLSQIVFSSGLAPFGMDTVEKVGIAIMYGAEVGLAPMTALQSIAIINGKPSIYGDAGVGLVQNSGLLAFHKEWFEGEPYADDFAAVCHVRRKGRKAADSLPVSFSVADAKKAKIWEKKTSKGGDTPWITHPKRMLMWRARSFAFRDQFSDVLKGLRFQEEVQDDDPALDRRNAPPRIESGVAARLSGPASNGFQSDHVEREMNGHTTTPSDYPEVFRPDEIAFVEEVAKALAEAKSIEEVAVAEEDFAEAYERQTPEVRDYLHGLFEKRRDALA